MGLQRVASKIALLGGTFNPIHIGHLRSAIDVIELLALDELRLIPNALPPHREQPNVSPQQRLEMVRLATTKVPKLVVDDRELRRNKPSYTIDTLLSIHAELTAEDQLFFIMGWDAFCSLPTWYRWQELLTHCHIIVLQRPYLSVKIPKELQGFLAGKVVTDAACFTRLNGQVLFLQQTVLDISSTHIRQALAQSKSVQFLVADKVLDYINEHKLYQEL